MRARAAWGRAILLTGRGTTLPVTLRADETSDIPRLNPSEDSAPTAELMASVAKRGSSEDWK